MDFIPDDTQSMLVDSIGRFVKERYGHAARRRSAADPQGCDRDIWRFLAEMGWLGAGLSEEAGGFGGGPVATMLVCEELGRGALVEPYLGSAVLAAECIAAAAPARAGALLAAMLAGDEVIAPALWEADSRYRLLPQATRAERRGDGWVLNGAKAMVLGGGAADRLLVSARVAGADGDAGGLALFLIPADRAGVGRRVFPLIDGQRVAEIDLADVAAGADEILGTPGEAHAALSAGLDRAAVAACALAVGAMERALWITRDHLRERRQFGVPIGSFQALQHRMADMFIELEQARSITYHAVAALCHATGAEQRRAVFLARLRVGAAARFVAAQAVQLHGGMGLTEEYPVGNYFRSLWVFGQIFGTVG